MNNNDTNCWNSIRKLLEATQENPVLTPEEVFELGAYFAHSSKKMVTIPFDLMKSYDKWLHVFTKEPSEGSLSDEIYIYLNAKLEEYLSPEELKQFDDEG